MEVENHYQSKYIVWSVLLIGILIFGLVIFIYGELVGKTYYVAHNDFEDQETEFTERGELLSLGDLSMRSFETIRSGARVLLNNTPLSIHFEREEILETVLSDSGVFIYTNIERERYGLGRLSASELLNQIALQKLNDMATGGYFAHVSPRGVDIGMVANQAGYRYAVIAENLARGNFLNDADMVSAWMASQGHRENILNGNFSHLGVAVRQVPFNDEFVWLGVQVFAKPLSACRQPNNDLYQQILDNKSLITAEENNLRQLKELINQYLSTDSRQEANDLIEDYNERVRSLNNLVRVTEASIVAYNNEVRSYNRCLGH